MDGKLPLGLNVIAERGIMCFLKLYNETSSFKDYAKTANAPVYSVFDKGEFRNKRKTKRSKEYSISFDVSDKEWDQFPEQVADAIAFLRENFSELENLVLNYNISDGYLDFPLYSRLNDKIVNQNDLLPRELISLAGKLNLGIVMSIYADDAFDELTS